jgi:oxygen-dependent protoporphyrinogen oxidase
VAPVTVLGAAVVGGGITGLVAARRLEEARAGGAGPAYAVFEEGETFGGTIRTRRRDGFLLEDGADSFLSEKPETLELVRELGLEPDIIRTSPESRRSFVVSGGALRAVPRGFYLAAPSRALPFLLSPLFTPWGKLRIAVEPFVRAADGGADESVSSFIRRRLGAEALERVGQAMVGGIYAGDPERLSVRAALPKFHLWEKEHGSVLRGLQRQAGAREARGPRYNLFLTLRGGMEDLARALAESIPAPSLRRRAAASSLDYDRAARLWRIGFADGTSVEARGVCLSVPAFRAGRLVRGFAPDLADLLERVHYESVAVLHFGWRRAAVRHALNGFGFVVPRREKFSLIGCSFSSVKYRGRAPEGTVLLRAFAGGAFGADLLRRSDEDILGAVRRDLERLLGIGEPPVLEEVRRSPNSMPQYEVGHEELVGRIEAAARAWPGLVLAGNAFHGVGISDCVRGGREAAERLLGSIKGGNP